MKLGIVGLPNVGKSTLFNAITNAGAESANYPFCTIEPNVGMVAVPDERLDKLAEMYAPKKKTPAVIEFVDIARARAQVSATSSLRTSAAPTPSCMLCAASTMKTSCTSWPTRAQTSPSTPWATLRPSTWSSSWPTSRW